MCGGLTWRRSRLLLGRRLRRACGFAPFLLEGACSRGGRAGWSGGRSLCARRLRRGGWLRFARQVPELVSIVGLVGRHVLRAHRRYRTPRRIASSLYGPAELLDSGNSKLPQQPVIAYRQGVHCFHQPRQMDILLLRKRCSLEQCALCLPAS